MSRARNIKPGFFKNDILAECSATTRLLFIALWCEADREGRLEYRPKRIKPACLPYDDVDIEDAVAELADRGFLSLYESAGAQYIQIVNWAKHQNPHHKEVGSEIPAPPGHIDTVCVGYIPLSNTIRNRIYARDGRVCKECGATHGLSIDHIVPVSRGGNSTDDNLQVLCLGCNVRKGNKFHASIMDEPCMDQASVKQIASCPTDSLIPDSLLLIPDPSSEANASGGAPPSDPPADPIWGTGLAFLMRKGIPEKSARGLLGKVKHALGDAEAARIIGDAETQDVSDPAPWLLKAIASAKARAGPGKSKPSIAQNFSEKTYTGTPDDELPDFLRTGTA